MIIKCNQCHTNYRIDPNQLKPFGKKVKCRKCSHIWFESYKEVVEDIIEPTPIPQNSSLPMVVENYTPFWLKFLPVMFLCFVFISYMFFYQREVTKTFPSLNSLYDEIGIPDTTHFALKNVSIKKSSDQLEVMGIIHNESNRKRIIPKIIISASNAKGESTSFYELDFNKKTIDANETKSFMKIVDSLPKNSEYITVSVVDKFDLFSKRS